MFAILILFNFLNARSFRSKNFLIIIVIMLQLEIILLPLCSPHMSSYKNLQNIFSYLVSVNPITVPGRIRQRVRDRHPGEHAGAALEEVCRSDSDGSRSRISALGRFLHAGQSDCWMGNGFNQ
jgi:hypothetical protein